MAPILYLHGFSTGTGSTKGAFLAEQFAGIGAEVVRPDLHDGDFFNTTISRQLDLVSRLVEELRPKLVIGSSLGGYVAALHASREPRSCAALGLMAPAFAFHKCLGDLLHREAMEEWRRTGETEFFHHGLGRMMPLSYGFYEDASKHDPYPTVTVPTVILHGWDDGTIPIRHSRRFFEKCWEVEMEPMDTDHGMLDVTEEIWDRMCALHFRVEPTPDGEGVT